MRREIHISYALNGYWCKVGCQLVVFEKRNELLCALSDYLQNPEATEARFRKEAVNPMEEEPQVRACDPREGLSPLRQRDPNEGRPNPVPMPPPCETSPCETFGAIR